MPPKHVELASQRRKRLTMRLLTLLLLLLPLPRILPKQIQKPRLPRLIPSLLQHKLPQPRLQPRLLIHQLPQLVLRQLQQRPKTRGRNRLGAPYESFPEWWIRPYFFGDEAGEEGGGDVPDEGFVGRDGLDYLYFFRIVVVVLLN